MVVGGRAPTATARALGAAALRMQLASELTYAGEKARVLSRTETCGMIKSLGQICDSTIVVKYIGSYAYLLHARLAMWVDADSNANGATVTPYVIVTSPDHNSFEESWSERIADASASNQNEAVRKFVQILPSIVAELPLLRRCQSEWRTAALDSLLPAARALVFKRSSSTLARLCIAKILDRANAPPDSILAVTSAILSVDRHNRSALSLAADALNRAMLMDSANVFLRELGKAYYTVVDSSMGLIHFSLAEVAGDNGGEPQMGFSFRTGHVNSCLLDLLAEYRVRADTITLGPFRMPQGPVLCAQAFGPATGGRSVALAPGRYVLRIVHADKSDQYSIVVTDSTITTVPTRAPLVTRVSDTLQWRVRRNTFALSCGAYEDAPWLCADAVRAVLSTKGIVPLATPAAGHHPYSGQGGFYHNEPLHYFHYSTFEDYQHAMESAFSVYEKIIGRQVGYALTFTDWRGRNAGTWLRNQLTPDSAAVVPNGGAPSVEPRPLPVRVGAQFRATQLELGADLSCALTTSSIVMCWGRDDVGQLGRGTVDTISHPVPEHVQLPLRVKQVTVGRDHACALSNEGAAYCWGSNAWGQIGAATTKRCLGDSPAPAPCAPSPVRVSGTFRFASLSAGTHSTCGLTVEHRVLCWGYISTIESDSLQPPRCGDTLSVDRCARTPQVIPRAPVTWTYGSKLFQGLPATVESGAFRSCSIDDQRQLYCWGFSQSWARPVGNTPAHEGAAVSALALGYRHACALDDTGLASCWGWRDLGALGLGDSVLTRVDERYAATYSSRRPVTGNLRFRELAAGWLHTCGITRDADSISREPNTSAGRLFCWGDNTHGQLGLPPTVSDTMTFAITDTSELARVSRRRGHPAPELIALPAKAMHVALGIDHSCAIVKGGAVYCWGRNLRGALGTSSTADDDWHPQAVIEFGLKSAATPSPQ